MKIYIGPSLAVHHLIRTRLFILAGAVFVVDARSIVTHTPTHTCYQLDMLRYEYRFHFLASQFLVAYFPTLQTSAYQSFNTGSNEHVPEGLFPA